VVAQSSFVSGAVLWSYDQVAKPLSKGLFRLPPEDLSSVAIPPYNQPTNVHDDDRIQCGVQNGLQPSMKEPPTHVHALLTRAFVKHFQQLQAMSAELDRMAAYDCASCPPGLYVGTSPIR
jgi:hypothetical protein